MSLLSARAATRWKEVCFIVRPFIVPLLSLILAGYLDQNIQQCCCCSLSIIDKVGLLPQSCKELGLEALHI